MLGHHWHLTVDGDRVVDGVPVTGAGYDVFAVSDAVGGVTPDAHERAMQRMIQAGAQPVTAIGMTAELQRHDLAGVLTDGRLRDFEQLGGYGFATWCSGEATRWGGDTVMPYEADVAVEVAGVCVAPGDDVYADASGAVVIPQPACPECSTKRTASRTTTPPWSRRSCQRERPTRQAAADETDRTAPYERREQGAAMTSREDLPAPVHGLVLTHFLTVHDVARSRAFYADILSGEVVVEENPAIVKVANTWIIMNPGGGPTPDKPDITLAPPEPSDIVSSFMNVRVADIAAFHADATAKGAQFLTEPIDRKAELRCYLRDPDGYLIEVGQATGMLEGIFADPPPSADDSA